MHFDVFNNDAFSLSQLSRGMVDLPHVPGQIGAMGIFSDEPVATTSVSIEKIGTTLALVQTSARGGPGKPVGNDKRELRSFNLAHLQEDGAVTADEVQNLRAFGSESDVETVQNFVNRKLAKMKRNIDITMEWHRIGAIKGQVLDADATTVLQDLFTQFGVAKTSLDFVLDSDTTNVKGKCTTLQRTIEDKLGGLPFTGIHVQCSAEFFDALTQHPAVVKAFERWMNGEFLRTQQRPAFWFGDVLWSEYRGSVNGQRFIEAGKAHAIPLGVPDLFITHYGPADYLETVNTLGLPYYAKQLLAPNGKRVDLEAQTNPLCLCTRPQAVVELSI
jgi:hypothetical protein